MSPPLVKSDVVFDPTYCQLVHDKIDENYQDLKEGYKDLKGQLEELKPQKWPTSVKLFALLGILGFLGSVIVFGINVGKTVTKSEFDPVAVDVAVSKTKIQNIETKLQESAADRKEMQQKLDTIIQRLIR
jgi:hypothetical protein